MDKVLKLIKAMYIIHANGNFIYLFIYVLLMVKFKHLKNV